MSILLILFCLLCCVCPAAAQVAFTVAGGTNSAAATATSVNFNITCSGSDRFILVQNSHRTTTGGPTAAGTYNSNALTSIRNDRADSSVGNVLLYYPTPDDVSRAVTCTLTSTEMLACTAMCFSGVDSGTPFGTAAGTYSAGATECDVAVTVAADGLAAGAGTRRQSGSSWTTADTSRNTQDTSNATAANNVRAIAATAAGTGSVTIDWTSDTTREMACGAIPLNPVAAAAVAPRQRKIAW